MNNNSKLVWDCFMHYEKNNYSVYSWWKIIYRKLIEHIHKHNSYLKSSKILNKSLKQKVDSNNCIVCIVDNIFNNHLKTKQFCMLKCVMQWKSLSITMHIYRQIEFIWTLFAKVNIMLECAHGVMNKQILTWINIHVAITEILFEDLFRIALIRKITPYPFILVQTNTFLLDVLNERSFSKKLNRLKLSLIPWLHFSNNVHCIKGRPLIDFYWCLWIWSKRDRTLINFYVLIRDRTIRKIMRVIIIKVKIILSQKLEDKLWRDLSGQVILTELDGGSMSDHCDYSRTVQVCPPNLSDSCVIS